MRQVGVTFVELLDIMLSNQTRQAVTYCGGLLRYFKKVCEAVSGSAPVLIASMHK